MRAPRGGTATARKTRWLRRIGPLLLAIACVVGRAPAEDETSPFAVALRLAEDALTAGKPDEAHRQAVRALERDARSPRAWAVLARWAEAVADRDEMLYALHREVELLRAQGAPKGQVQPLQKRLEALDPMARRFLELTTDHVERLVLLAKEYERTRRPHAAIRVYQEALGLDPERRDAAEAVQRISAAPDPSLAETAKAKDLLADVSEEWIREHDAKHATWETRATLERPNYVTVTDAGYAVLLRTAESMEQMNAFYRQFFRYGTEDDGKQVPRIHVHVFRDRDEYLTLGIGPPVKWSGGHFTGGAVETYIGDGGFDATVGTLFHEAAHQFVALATTAAGWLNEGLASFFEGCRILPNGTVRMNLPANHRLFPLATRMEKGWMTSATDGIDAAKPSESDPARAPTWRIVLENEYEWGPPWYAPTWGVVYFLYNFQDPADGRFVYRKAFREYVNTSGGRVGKGAIRNFEEVVLENPSAPTKGMAEAKVSKASLPKTVDDLSALWKEWILRLRDEQSGRLVVERPYLAWARNALVRKDHEEATEHFEKGVIADPGHVDLLVEFADHLASRSKNADRAAKLVLQALRILEAAPTPDAARVAALEQRLTKWDSRRGALRVVHESLWTAARKVAQGYLDAGLNLLAMHAAVRLGQGLSVPGMTAIYEDAARRSGKNLSLWRVAYNERDLAGWLPDLGKVFQPYGAVLRSRFGEYEPGSYLYYFLTLDQMTSGDFSLETEVLAEKGKNAFTGLVFGRKSEHAFHGVVLFPEGAVDLASFYSPGVWKTWRHETVPEDPGRWRTLRVDVVGTQVDVWCDGARVASQEFPSTDVLRGGFGLLTGPGSAQFRNVRFLARPAHDPTAATERAVRLEEWKKKGAAAAGSFVGAVPPFPTVDPWLQGSRASWAEKGPVPTLLVLWSVHQNELIPLHPWLTHLAKRHAGTGLEIVSVCEAKDPDEVRAYLATHRFPGTVGVDVRLEKEEGYGRTLDAYQVGKRFGFPRVLLLDIDQRVVWEGNPGFDVGTPWSPETPSYLDTPLDELVAKRNLVRLVAWRKAWAEGAADRLRAGEIDGVASLLRESKDLPADVVPEVASARAMLATVEEALADLEGSAAALAKAEAEPAVNALFAWAAALAIPVDPAKEKAARRHLTTARARAFESLRAQAEKTKKALDSGADATATWNAFLEKARTQPGAIPASAVLRLSYVLILNDADGARRVLDTLDRAPALWLATERFRF